MPFLRSTVCNSSPAAASFPSCATASSAAPLGEPAPSPITSLATQLLAASQTPPIEVVAPPPTPPPAVSRKRQLSTLGEPQVSKGTPEGEKEPSYKRLCINPSYKRLRINIESSPDAPIEILSEPLTPKATKSFLYESIIGKPCTIHSNTMQFGFERAQFVYTDFLWTIYSLGVHQSSTIKVIFKVSSDKMFSFKTIFITIFLSMVAPQTIVLPEDIGICKALGWIANNCGDHSEWTRRFNKAFSKSPEGAKWYQMLSHSPQLLGNRYERRVYFSPESISTLVFEFVEVMPEKEPLGTAPSQVSSSSSASSSPSAASSAAAP
jgi:hypothetical protein